jgi:hypothetical protein
MVYKKRLQSLREGKIYWRSRKVKKRANMEQKRKKIECAALGNFFLPSKF